MMRSDSTRRPQPDKDDNGDDDDNGSDSPSETTPPRRTTAPPQQPPSRSYVPTPASIIVTSRSATERVVTARPVVAQPVVAQPVATRPVARPVVVATPMDDDDDSSESSSPPPSPIPATRSTKSEVRVKGDQDDSETKSASRHPSHNVAVGRKPKRQKGFKGERLFCCSLWSDLLVGLTEHIANKFKDSSIDDQDDVVPPRVIRKPRSVSFIHSSFCDGVMLISCFWNPERILRLRLFLGRNRSPRQLVMGIRARTQRGRSLRLGGSFWRRLLIGGMRKFELFFAFCFCAA